MYDDSRGERKKNCFLRLQALSVPLRWLSPFRLLQFWVLQSTLPLPARSPVLIQLRYASEAPLNIVVLRNELVFPLSVFPQVSMSALPPRRCSCTRSRCELAFFSTGIAQFSPYARAG